MKHSNGTICDCWYYRPDHCVVCLDALAVWKGEKLPGHDHFHHPIEETMRNMLARLNKLNGELEYWQGRESPMIAKAVREDIGGQRRAIERAIRINPKLADMVPACIRSVT